MITDHNLRGITFDFLKYFSIYFRLGKIVYLVSGSDSIKGDRGEFQVVVLSHNQRTV